MDENLAQRTVRRYVCARCWGHLIIMDDRGADGLRAICPKNETGDCDGHGYVTKRYAERRKEESLSELYEVRDNYPDLEERKSIPATAEAILSELGF